MKGIGLQGIGMITPIQKGVATSNIVPWYLAGGIPLANCVGAYQTQGAADLAASQVNVAHPGIHDLSLIGIVILDALLGWGFSAVGLFDTGIVPESTWSMIARWTSPYGGPFAGVASSNTFPSPEIDFYMGMDNIGAYFPEYHVGLNQTDGITVVTYPETIGVAQYQGYANGLPDAPPAAPYVWSAADCLYSIYLGGYNVDGVPSLSSYFLSNFAVYDIPITAAQMLAVSNALLAL